TVLVINPDGPLGWAVKIPAIVALVCAGARMVVALREIRATAEALRASLTDELTGLPDRRALLLATDEALTPGAGVGLLLLDLDSVRGVNGGLGPQHGDDLLVSLAGRLRAAAPARSVVARLGGDEFAVLLHDADELRLLERAHHLRHVLREPLQV